MSVYVCISVVAAISIWHYKDLYQLPMDGFLNDLFESIRV